MDADARGACSDGSSLRMQSSSMQLVYVMTTTMTKAEIASSAKKLTVHFTGVW